MERMIHDETNGLDYELVGDYYLPCLKAPKSPKVGRFGLMCILTIYEIIIKLHIKVCLFLEN